MTKIRNGRFDVIRKDVFGDAPDEDDQDGFGHFNRFNLNDFLHDDATFEEDGDLSKLDDFYDHADSGKLFLKNGKGNNGLKNGGGSRKSKKQF